MASHAYPATLQFTLQTLVAGQRANGRELSLVIDLTNTHKYYNAADLDPLGVAVRPLQPARCHPPAATRPLPPAHCHPPTATRPLPPAPFPPHTATRSVPPTHCTP